MAHLTQHLVAFLAGAVVGALFMFLSLVVIAKYEEWSRD